jgi:hypothetical protein
MFCPQCSHRQASNDVRFCARCGLSLGLVTDVLANSSDQIQREKRELTGISLMMATVFLLLNFMIVFGAVTLPHLAKPVFLWIWLSFVVSSLIVGGFALANLIRGGFFKRMKERESRLHLLKLADERHVSSKDAITADIAAEETPRLAEPASISETTTRELEAVPRKAR